MKGVTIAKMNEIDLYVELIDDRTANKILKEFKETVPGFSRNPSLQQKKHHIRNIFRGRTNQLRKKRSMKADPFYFHLSSYKNAKSDEVFGDYDAKGMFHAFSQTDELPDHVKLAVALVYQPDALREHLPQLIQNFEQGKPLFDLQVSFKTREEVEEYLRAGSDFFSEEGLSHFLDRARKFLPDEELKRLEELEEDIRPLSLVEFHNKQQDYRHDSLTLTYYAFASTHPEESAELRQGIALTAAYRLIKKNHEKWKQLASQLETLEEERKKAALLQEQHEELKHEHKELADKLKDIERDKKQIEREHNALEEHLQRVTCEHERLTQQGKKEQEALEQKLAAAQEKWERMKQEFSGEGPFREFAVVTSGESEMLRIWFPEISAFAIKDWNQQKHQLLEFARVYFQRDGLNTKLINMVQSFCRKNGIQPHFFIARNEKELIESIAYFKRQSMEG